MSLSGVQEAVTVTGEAPLLDTASSTIASNIDPRQMQDIPINGRNWMDLTMLSAGSRSNASSEVPQDRQGYFQTNVDGQSVTLTVCCAQNQPRYSRDSIAEFQLTTNRFDATQGRTMGMMVNAITKSGTNIFTGRLGGYFRSDKWNAADFIQKTVLRIRISRSAARSAGRSSRTASTSSATGSTSAIRRRSPSAAPAARSWAPATTSTRTSWSSTS